MQIKQKKGRKLGEKVRRAQECMWNNKKRHLRHNMAAYYTENRRRKEEAHTAYTYSHYNVSHWLFSARTSPLLLPRRQLPCKCIQSNYAHLCACVFFRSVLVWVGVSCSTTQIIAKPHTQLSLRWLPGNKTPFKNNRAKNACEINEQVMPYRSLYTFLLRENINKKN